MTLAAREVLAQAPVVFVRTARHLAAEPLVAAGARPLDAHYEAAESFAETYAEIVEELVAAAHLHGVAAYGVPGSPYVLERTVELLRRDERVRTEIVPGLSFLDLAWDRLGIDPVAAGVRLVGAEDFAVESAGERGPFLVGHCWNAGLLSEVKLAVEEPPEGLVVILHHLGHPDEQVLRVPLEELDRCLDPDHLTCVYVPELPSPVGSGLARLDEVLRVLRQRCPWDAEQTHQSLVRHLLEETYEVIEAVEELGGPAVGGGPPEGMPLEAPVEAPVEAPAFDPGAAAHLEEELGDLLTQVFFHARLAAEEGLFNLSDVARTVTEKLVHRHPHVFDAGGAEVPTAGSIPSARGVEQRWEHLKQAEKGRQSLLEGIPEALPALMLAGKLERKARSVDLGWAATGVGEPELARWLAEVAAGSVTRAGKLLFALARLTAHLGEDPEELVRRAAGRMRRQFTAAEQAAGGAFLAAGAEARLAFFRGAAPDAD